MEKAKDIAIEKDIYWFLWEIQRLLDKGHKEDIHRIISECEDNNIYNYISGKYDLPMIEHVGAFDKANINYMYMNAAIDIDRANSKYDVHKNGLVYLSVIAIEWLYTGFTFLLDNNNNNNNQNSI